MTSSIPQDRGPRAAGVVAGLWTLALLPIGGLMGVVTILGASPTSCNAPAPLYCTQEWLGLLTIVVAFGGWLATMALSFSAWLHRRSDRLLTSVGVLVVSVVLLVVLIAIGSS